MIVQKRDERKVKFDKEKIITAVLSAFNEVDGEIIPEAKRKATNIANHIESLDKKHLSVEEIQDIVESLLMASKRKDVAKAYIIYRNNRSMIRESQSNFIKKYMVKLMQLTLRIQMLM
ncbi:MAG: hypothetical protein HDR11_01560 [Lachnospiraceae bacterium]|nr:hypothetical protein [Lachnospiraceae bacterium]